MECQKCRTSCDKDQYAIAKCGAVPGQPYVGQDLACSECPLHSKLGATSAHRNLFGGAGTMRRMKDCECDAGFYDAALPLSVVDCTPIPPQFWTGASKTAKCKVQKFGAGLKEQINLTLSPSNTMQLGAMAQYFKGLPDTATFYDVDFDNACGQLLRQYRTEQAYGSICGHSFPLFGKFGNNATHATFLGKAVLQCNGISDVEVLLTVCVDPCISDPSQGCCWVPTFAAPLFGCCEPYGCCHKTNAPTPAPTLDASATGCKDMHTTCPRLRTELDAHNGSCFTSDFGQVTGVAKFNRMHLNDQCCASCQPHCASCLSDGHDRGYCAAIGVCRASLHCTLPKTCKLCMTQSTLAQCKAYGIDCKETCTESNVTPAHRRLQAVGAGAVAVQVQRGASSRQ